MSRFDETIKNMQEIAGDIKEAANRKLQDANEDETLKIKTVAEKTIGTIDEAGIRLRNVVEQIKDEDELNKFLDRVDEKWLNVYMEKV